jgi:hypothetical protein
MNKQLADRARSANQAQQQAAALRREADRASMIGETRDLLLRRLERLGIDADDGELSEFDRGVAFTLEVTDDATLIIDVRKTSNEVTTNARLTACDQLYLDLPPGQLERTSPGGVYGHYNLSEHSAYTTQIETIADLGKVLELIERAREQWQTKHRGRRPAA